MPTVSRWWRDRTDPERIELYTRWSFYGWLAMTPVLALGVYGSAGTDLVQPFATLYLVASVAVTGAAILLARAGLTAHREERSSPRPQAVAAGGAALVAAALAVPAFAASTPESPALAWGVAMPAAMVLSAASTAWDTRALVRVGAAIGAVTGVVLVTAGDPVGVGVTLAVVIGVAVTFLAVAWRFSVWVLDVVTEMDRTRGVQLQLAVAEERLRFARDLHDVMGRNLSAIAVKGQLAGELVRRSRPEAADEVADISRIAEESLREVREVVRGYRAPDLRGELAGARSVLRAAGFDCAVSGEERAGSLPEPAQAALGWVVREAVTNVLRHSAAGTCSITLGDRDGTGNAELTVTNDGVAGDGVGSPSWGNGLTGLGERLWQAGGSLAAERDGDRFRLVATVPAGGAA